MCRYQSILPQSSSSTPQVTKHYLQAAIPTKTLVFYSIKLYIHVVFKECRRRPSKSFVHNSAKPSCHTWGYHGTCNCSCHSRWHLGMLFMCRLVMLLLEWCLSTCTCDLLHYAYYLKGMCERLNIKVAVRWKQEVV